MNIWQHPSVIAAEALRHLEDALVVTRMCAVDKTSEFSRKANGWKVGDVVSFRTHGDYAVDDFGSAGTINIQDISTSKRSMEIEKHLDISVQVTSREESLDLDSYSDQVIRPAAYRLAEYCDTYVGTKIMQAAGCYASSGLFTTAADVAQARKVATIQQLAMERFCLVDLETEATLLGQTWFNQAQTRGDVGVSTLQSGIMGRVMGMDFYSSIGFPTSSHIAGTMQCLTNNDGGAANKIGDSILTVDNQLAAQVLNAGDRIQVAGVRRPLIVKTAIPVTTGATAIELVDPITELIPDDAAVTVVGDGATLNYRGAIFDSRSLAVAFPVLDAPGDKVTAVASNNGVSIRVVKGYDMQNKTNTMSLDLLIGAFAYDPRRITLCADS